MPTQKPKSLSDDLRRRALRAQLSYAIFRWESALTLAMTLILIVFLPRPFGDAWALWRPWFWIALGLAAEVLIVVTSVYDPAVRERIVGEMFRQRFNYREVKTADYRAKVVKALEYREQMELLLQHTRDGALRTHLEATISDVSDWLGNMFHLARRLDYYRNSMVLHQDSSSLPTEIRDLEQRLAAEADAQLRTQLEQTAQGKRAQLQQLARLDSTMRRAELQLDETLTAMGTVYAQMQLIGARDIDSGRAQRLRQDIADEMWTQSGIYCGLADQYQDDGWLAPG